MLIGEAAEAADRRYRYLAGLLLEPVNKLVSEHQSLINEHEGEKQKVLNLCDRYQVLDRKHGALETKC